MALYPCDLHDHRYPGPQSTMYPAIAQGSDSDRRKLRLCRPHYTELHERLEGYAIDESSELYDPDKQLCIECGLPASDALYQFFVTCYGPGGKREDFWAPLHQDCHAEAMLTWRLSANTPQYEPETTLKGSLRPKRSNRTGS